jgi:hypothetical protein
MIDKKLPIGVSDFKEIIKNEHYFIDKSLFIKDVVEGAKVLLYPRPRRFGKTLNLSMLRYFYNKNGDNSALFKDLMIAKEEKIMQKQGKHPVIFITLKDVKCETKEKCFNNIFELITKLFIDHLYILESGFLAKYESEYFEKILSKTADSEEYANALKYLSEYLFKYHQVNPVILIDEYDTPIQAAYHYNYYDDLIIFMRNFLSGALKDNEFLEKAVLTGILRVSKESLFSGLNNIMICSILDEAGADKFGFTEPEVRQLLKDYNFYDKFEEVKALYDGYNFGENGIYNPWSILYCVNAKKFKTYWANTSDNSLIKELCSNAGESVKRDMEILLEKGSIKKAIDDNIVFADLKKKETLWSFMLMCGYIRYDNLSYFDDNLATTAFLSIPNTELLSIFVNDVVNWFKRPTKTAQLETLLNHLTHGDIEVFKKEFADFCLTSFSYHDVGGHEPEKFYHAFVLGMLVCLRDRYHIRSNRESGDGRYDVMLVPRLEAESLRLGTPSSPFSQPQAPSLKPEPSFRGIIFEFKTVDTTQRETFESAMEYAKTQLIEKKYDQELKAQGVQEIVHIIAVFQGKEVRLESF